VTAPSDAATLREAIDDYHALLSNDIAGESQARLDAQLRERGLFFGDRPLCTVLRPRFFTPGQHRGIRRRIAPLLAAFRRAHDAAIATSAVLDQFRLADWERDLVHWKSGFRDPSPISRLDAFYTPDDEELWFTEYNAEVPAGAAYGDVLAEVFHSLPIMREFVHRWHVHSLPARPHTLHALIDAWQQFSGSRVAPRIAILDWREVPTQSEFRLFQRYFAEHGVESVIVDPAEVDYDGERLSASDGPIDLVYKRVLTTELVERGGIDHPVLRAVKDGAVCMVNPPACKILHKKASLAVLHDERNASLFDAEERQAIFEHVPWTRVVEERRTTHRGRDIDLIEFIRAERERLVLKPNDDYGGKGIVLGWETDAAAWDRAVALALAEPYIVQERVRLPFEAYPSLVDGNVHVVDRMVDTAPYVAYGAFTEGYLSRLSTASLLNVTAGGGSQTPTFIVEKR